jgi:hypothetical protein
MCRPAIAPNTGFYMPKISRPSSNGAAGQEAAAAALAADFVASASVIPNIDGRASVLTDLPNDTFLPDRGDYAVGEVKAPKSMMFGHAKDQDWARCHPDGARFKKMLCIKDKSSRALYPITASLVNSYPRLQVAARPYIIRQAKILDGPEFLWAAPWPSGREVLGDVGARQAQEDALTDWVRMMWDGNDWDVIHTDPPHVYDDPVWGEESFEDVLRRGLLPLLLHDLTSPFIKKLLGLGK